MVIVIIVVLGALVVGMLANRFVRPMLMKDDTAGIPATDLFVYGPVVTLSIFFLALVLFGAAGSYGRAGAAASDEANVVDNFFEATEYVKKPRQKIGMQAALVCYARAVEGPEWDAMAAGTTSTVPNNWTGTGPHGLRLKLLRLGTADGAFGMLTGADKERGDTRRDRLKLAKPQIPGVIFGFTLALVGLLIVALAFFSPRVNNRLHVITLLLIGVTLLVALAIIQDLDRPYGGGLAVAPTEMSITAGQITDDFVGAHGADRLPCDQQGRPRDPAS